MNVSSGTSSPGYSWKKCHKMVAIVLVASVSDKLYVTFWGVGGCSEKCYDHWFITGDN